MAVEIEAVEAKVKWLNSETAHALLKSGGPSNVQNKLYSILKHHLLILFLTTTIPS